MKVVYAAVLLAGLWTSSLRASRFEVIAQHQGERVPHARVCFTKASDDVDLVRRFLSSREIRCYPADDILEIPSGRWHLFTAKDRALVSSHPFEIVVPKTEGGGLLHGIEVEMREAAELDFTSVLPSLQEDEFPAVYISNNDQAKSPASLRPVGADAVAVVPAGTEVTPLIVRGERIVRIFSAYTLRAGEKLRIPAPEPATNKLRDIAVQVRMANVRARGATAPSLRVLIHDNTVVATAALRPTPLFHDSMIFVRGVPVTATTIELAGEGWTSSRQTLAGRAELSTIHIADALVVDRTAELSINWTVDPAVAEQPRSGCGDAEESEPASSAPRLTLYRCTPDQARALRRGRRAGCEVVHTRELAAGAVRGAETIENVAVGTYEAELQLDAYSAIETVTWDARTDTEIPIDLRASFVTGRVTRNGLPVTATLNFPNGRTVTEPATGAYRLLITRPIEQRTLVSVEPCGEVTPYVHLVSTPVIANAVIDIDIPVAGLEVVVTNAANDAPVPEALVRVYEDGVEFPTYELEIPPTDATGRTSISPVLRETPLVVCAGAPKYTRDCRRGIEVDGRTEQVRLRLQPQQSAVSGRVVSTRPLRGARLWLLRGGAVIATSAIAADRTFALDARPEDVSVAVTDKTYGLAVLGAPAFDSDGTMVVTLPDLPPLTFAVSVSAAVRGAKSQITLRIGDVLLPRTVFIEHQGNMGTPADIVPGAAFVVSKVIPIGVVHVVLGYPFESIRGLQGDMFGRPDLVATMPQKAVVGTSVVFD
jgi:hypothetical protein